MEVTEICFLLFLKFGLLFIFGLINEMACREPNLHESPGSSEYSTGSTLVSQTAEEKIDQSQPEIGTHHQEPQFESGSSCTREQYNIGESEKEILPKTNLERGNE